MNSMTRIATLATLVLAAGTTFAAQDPATHPTDMAMPGMKMDHTASQAAGEAPLTNGIVKKVDIEQGKITLQHEALENLGMPGMTMVFRAADPKLLQEAQVGQAVAFRAERVNGALVVTQLRRQ